MISICCIFEVSPTGAAALGAAGTGALGAGYLAKYHPETLTAIKTKAAEKAGNAVKTVSEKASSMFSKAKEAVE